MFFVKQKFLYKKIGKIRFLKVAKAGFYLAKTSSNPQPMLRKTLPISL
jgi:hypothetical protein